MKKYITSIILGLTLVGGFAINKTNANSVNNNLAKIIEASTTNTLDLEEIKKNEQSALEIIRLFHSAQMTHQAGQGNGNFTSIQELFLIGYIDGSVANAAGCPKMKQTEYNEVCKGNGEARRGYKFQLVHQKAEKDKPSTFAAVAIPVIAIGENMTGRISLFVDESGVIRYSDDPNVIANAKSKYVGQ
ncbi:MAG: hypothetical protein HY819_16825 [Acidobacteria bacterium]|nr:hypothetical protein [Acidobacteriota bacterium]